MRRAEFAPADEFDLRVLRAQLLFERGEDFVAGEKIVPQLGDDLPVERVSLATTQGCAGAVAPKK